VLSQAHAFVGASAAVNRLTFPYPRPPSWDLVGGCVALLFLLPTSSRKVKAVMELQAHALAAPDSGGSDSSRLPAAGCGCDAPAGREEPPSSCAYCQPPPCNGRSRDVIFCRLRG